MQPATDLLQKPPPLTRAPRTDRVRMQRQSAAAASTSSRPLRPSCRRRAAAPLCASAPPSCTTVRQRAALRCAARTWRHAFTVAVTRARAACVHVHAICVQRCWQAAAARAHTVAWHATLPPDGALTTPSCNLNTPGPQASSTTTRLPPPRAPSRVRPRASAAASAMLCCCLAECALVLHL